MARTAGFRRTKPTSAATTCNDARRAQLRRGRGARPSVEGRLTPTLTLLGLPLQGPQAAAKLNPLAPAPTCARFGQLNGSFNGSMTCAWFGKKKRCGAMPSIGPTRRGPDPRSPPAACLPPSAAGAGSPSNAALLEGKLV